MKIADFPPQKSYFCPRRLNYIKCWLQLGIPGDQMASGPTAKVSILRWNARFIKIIFIIINGNNRKYENARCQKRLIWLYSRNHHHMSPWTIGDWSIILEPENQTAVFFLLPQQISPYIRGAFHQIIWVDFTEKSG